MYANIKPWFSIPGTNRILYVNSISIGKESYVNSFFKSKWDKWDLKFMSVFGKLRLWDHYFMYIYVQTIFYTKPVFLSLKIAIMSFEEKERKQ